MVLALFPAYREVEEPLAERRSTIHHVTLCRWVQRYTPELERRLNNRLNATNDPWRADETYVRVKGKWRWPYLSEPWIPRARPWIFSSPPSTMRWPPDAFYSATLELLDRRLYADAFELMERSRALAVADMMATRRLSLSRGDGQQLYAESVRS